MRLRVGVASGLFGRAVKARDQERRGTRDDSIRTNGLTWTTSQSAEARAPSQAPAHLGVSQVQAALGNGLIAEGLFADAPSPLAQIASEHVTYSVAGVQQDTPGSATFSNQAMLAMLAAARESGLDLDDPAVHVIGRLSGQPLAAAVLERMNAAFGHDFAHVRIFTGGSSRAAAEALNAHAFTVGSDIYFGSGEYAPGTTEGDRLLAHELTHVKQADEGRLHAKPGSGLDVSSPTDPSEREAYATADAIVADLSTAAAVETPAVESGTSAAMGASNAGSVATDGLALRQEAGEPAHDEEQDAGGIDIPAALEDGLSQLEAPTELAPVTAEVPPPAPLTEGPPVQEATPAELSSTDANTTQVGRSVAGVTAPEIGPGGNGLSVAGPATVASQVPQVQASHGEFSTAMATLRGQIADATTAQETALVSASDTAKSAIDTAAQAMRTEVQAAFEATRTAIREQATATRDSLKAELEARKLELREANAAQKARVLETSAAHQTTLGTLYTNLAATARTHGATKAEEIRTQADTQMAVARQAGATVASQYSSHNRANDIRITCQRMAQETAQKFESEIKANAVVLARDGNALADKLLADGAQHVRNIANGDADTTLLFDLALTDAEAALDETLDDTLTQVDDAEQQSLDGVDSLEESVLDQLDDVADAQTAGVDSVAADAAAAVQDAGQRALDALDEQIASVDSWLETAHPSQWPLVVEELARVRDALNEKGALVVDGLGTLGTSAVQQLTDAGNASAEELAQVATDLQPQLDAITDGCAENLTGIEETYATALGDQVTTYTDTWTTEANNKVSDLNAALASSQENLNQTSTDGLAEINRKYTETIGKMSEMLGTLRSELASKAEEIANQSRWDRFVSGLKNFALGLVDALVDFAKTLLIVALVILAVVLVIALIILIVAGAEVLLAVAAAVAAFAAAAAEIVAVICLILTVLSVVFSVVSVIAAWSNPNLTSDERWRATGKGVGDIVMEFLPDFGISLLTKADDASDAARAIENGAQLLNQTDNVGDGARAIETAGDIARGTDELGDVATSATQVATRADEAADVARVAEETTRAADNIPVAPRNAQTNSLPEPANLVDEAGARHILDGDGPGSGGHRFGQGRPGKTEFPQSWSDADVLHHASDIATDPAAIAGASNSTRLYNRAGDPIRNTFYGVRDGVIVKVVVEPATGRIVTAYPLPPGASEVPAALRNAPGLRPTTPNPPATPTPTTPTPTTPTPTTATPAPTAGGPATPTPAQTPATPSPTTAGPTTGGPTTGGPTTGAPTTGAPTGASRFDPENAPEWLKRYRDIAARNAEAEGVVRPQLQAAYDLFKGFAMSSYQAVNGSGLLGNGFAQNVAMTWSAITGWLGSNEEQKEEIERK